MIATEAALLHSGSRGLAAALVEVDEPLAREVRVAVSHVGLCHSDLHYLDGTLAIEVPAILGHEVSGVVEAVGDEVTTVSAGDQVIVNLTPSCGVCPNCEAGRPTICSRVAASRSRVRPAVRLPDGTAVTRLAGVGGFARHTVVSEASVIQLPPAVPAQFGCLLGCCVATGVGSVFHGACVRPGSTVVVIGCGGVGSAIVQGARIAGASEIIAIDLSEERLAAARSFGATATINGSREQIRDEVRAIVPTGVDYSFEAVGSSHTAALALDALRPGGTATIVGIAPDGASISVPASAFFFDEKRLIGSYMGSSRLRGDLPEYARLYVTGALLLDELVSEVVSLENINHGFELMRSGATTRVVVDMAR